LNFRNNSLYRVRGAPAVSESLSDTSSHAVFDVPSPHTLLAGGGGFFTTML
jgi:hypothetical protein